MGEGQVCFLHDQLKVSPVVPAASFFRAAERQRCRSAAGFVPRPPADWSPRVWHRAPGLASSGSFQCPTVTAPFAYLAAFLSISHTYMTTPLLTDDGKLLTYLQTRLKPSLPIHINPSTMIHGHLLTWKQMDKSAFDLQYQDISLALLRDF